MTSFTYLKNKINTPNRNKLIDNENKLITVRWEAGRAMGEKGEGMKKYKLPVITKSRGCEAQHREYGQRYCNNYSWCQVGTGLTREIAS